MEQKVVLKEDNKYIFLLKNEQFSFYIIIPRINKLSIALSIFDNINDEKIKEITNIPDKAIIVPLINNKVLNEIKNNYAEYYNYLEKLFAIIVNTSYKLLKFNNIDVNNKIILDKNDDYLNFNNWYLTKYKERVELIDLGIHKSAIVSKPLFEGIAEPKITNTNTDINVTLTNFNADEISNQNNIIQNEEAQASSAGFISYVLLGVIVAVISLVILYMLV